MCGKGEKGHPSFYESFAASRAAYNDFMVNPTMIAHEIVRKLISSSLPADKDYIGSEAYKVVMSTDCLAMVSTGSFDLCSKFVPNIVENFIKGEKENINSVEIENIVTRVINDYEKYSNEYAVSVSDEIVFIMEVKRHIEDCHRVIDSVVFYISKPKNIEFK